MRALALRRDADHQVLGDLVKLFLVVLTELLIRFARSFERAAIELDELNLVRVMIEELAHVRSHVRSFRR